MLSEGEDRRFYTSREQNSTSLSSSTSPLPLLTCTACGIPCHAIIPNPILSDANRAHQSNPKTRALHLHQHRVVESNAPKTHATTVYALSHLAPSEWMGSPHLFFSRATRVGYLNNTPAGTVSDALPSKHFSFAGCVGPINGDRGHARAWWVEKGYNRPLTRNYTRECAMSEYEDRMSRSVFMLISAWVKVQICFAGHVWIGRVHAHDDVGRHGLPGF